MKTYDDIEGYSNFLDFYDTVFKKYNGKEDCVFVEVGVWLGKSIIYMADLIKSNNSTIKLYAVDNFTGTENPNRHGKKQKTKVDSEEKYGGNFYYQFNQNLIDCGVRDYVIDIPKPSLEAVNEFEDESIDFVFIDGDHHYKAISKDLEAWYPKIKKGGIFSGHDIRHPGVKKAINAFSVENNLSIKPVSKSSWILKMV